MYVNSKDFTAKAAINGQKAEDIFENWLIKTNRKYRKATFSEQCKHIDFIIHSKKVNKEVKIDVKALKRINRKDNEQNSNYIWVEFKNVQGRNGWLYGDNDYIAFQNNDNSFSLVETDKLANMCENKCNNGITTKSTDVLYKRYTRKGRKDELSMIKFEDLKECGYITIKI